MKPMWSEQEQKSYNVPYGEGEDIFVEKKSRFISHIYPVTSSEEAEKILSGWQKEFWDASCIVYGFILRDGAMRFSDGGEPRGTAGLPTLDMLRKEEIFDALCVTRRYFGGTLLGAGGLTRAYGKVAKMALDKAGIAVMEPHVSLTVECPYSFFETLRNRFPRYGVVEDNIQYGADVCFSLFMPSSNFQDFSQMVTDLTRGKVIPVRGEERMFPRRVR